METTTEIEAIDIPTMTEMTDKEYEEYVTQNRLFYVDHHDLLRSAVAGYPIATSKAQMKILIKYLQSLLQNMV